MENYCNCHEKFRSEIKDLKKVREDHEKIWDRINSKVGMRLYLFILSIMLSFMAIIGGTQIKIMYSISALDKTVSVLTVKTESKFESLTESRSGASNGYRNKSFGRYRSQD